MNTDFKSPGKRVLYAPKARSLLTPSDESGKVRNDPRVNREPRKGSCHPVERDLEFFDEAAKYFPDTISRPSFARAPVGVFLFYLGNTCMGQNLGRIVINELETKGTQYCCSVGGKLASGWLWLAAL